MFVMSEQQLSILYDSLQYDKTRMVYREVQNLVDSFKQSEKRRTAGIADAGLTVSFYFKRKHTNACAHTHTQT